MKIENTGSNFVIIINNKRKHFSRDELRKLIKISHVSKNKTEGAGMLFRWLKRERSDVLMDVGIGSTRSIALIELRKVLKNNYTVKE